MASPILTIVEDLLFLTKIQQTAQLIGVSIQIANLRGLALQLAEQAPRAVILDLNHHAISALELVRTLKSDVRTKAVPILGFVSHVQTALIASAREAGCDLVLARSAFTLQLPQLLRQLAGNGPAFPPNL